MDRRKGEGKHILKTLADKMHIFYVVVFLILGIALIALIYPEKLISVAILITGFLYETFDWVLRWIPLMALVFGCFLIFSKYGKMRFGGNEAKTEYSTFSWMSMLFTAGIGVGIIFYGPIEGLWQNRFFPMGISGNFDQQQAMMNAMSSALFVWGLPAWAIYMFGGLIVSYFAYFHNGSFSLHSCFEIALKQKRYVKPLSKVVLCLTMMSIALSVTASIAMAVGQITNGASLIFGNMFESLEYKIGLLIGLVFACFFISFLPISKGMRVLGSLTMFVSIGMVIYLFVVGPTHYYISLIVSLIGRILIDSISLSFEFFLFKSLEWSTWYLNSYIVWWITWMPFVAVFLAKISRGRTIREFIICSTMIPTGFMIVWFSIFSGYGFLNEIQGDGKLVKLVNSLDFEKAIYVILNAHPFGDVLSVIMIFLLVAFVITTVVPIIISLEGMMVGEKIKRSKICILFWCIVIFLISFAIVVSNKVEGIKSAGSLIGFPFVFLFFLMIASLVRQMRRDAQENK